MAAPASEEIVSEPCPRGSTATTSSAHRLVLVWIVVSYFPVSNIPVLLPDRPRRALLVLPRDRHEHLARIAWRWLLHRAEKRGRSSTRRPSSSSPFFVLPMLSARRHANDYTDDLVFWDATRKAVPRSAKAHLNYSVMQGARRRPRHRASQSNETALELAPEWPMASVYMGDTLCRLHRAQDAWPYYEKGFEPRVERHQSDRARRPMHVGRAGARRGLTDPRQAVEGWRGAPGIVARVHRARHARQRGGAQRGRSEVSAARVQRGAEKRRVIGDRAVI